MEAMGFSRENVFGVESLEGCCVLPEEEYVEYYSKLYSFYKSKLISILD